MARLIRTEKEVEGRYEEVWLVVEEDALDQWPAGPARSSAAPATCVDGRERATGQAVYTADLQKPGMLHAAVLRSPHPHARVARIDLAPALALPGVHAAIGPDDIEQLAADAPPGHRRSPPCAPTRSRRHGPRFARSRATGRCSSPCWTPTKPCAGVDARRASRARARRLRAAPRRG